MNAIGDEVANSQSRALRVNTSLSSLNLLWRAIPYDEADSSSQELIGRIPFEY